MTDIEAESVRGEFEAWWHDKWGKGARAEPIDAFKLAEVAERAYAAGRKAQAEAERVGRAPEYAALGRLVQEHAALKAELRSIVKRIQKVLR